jgi:hypothetical protein
MGNKKYTKRNIEKEITLSVNEYIYKNEYKMKSWIKFHDQLKKRQTI